jgi:hypothetical protein
MKLTKQTAFKVALLLVLALNVSWQKLEVGSRELASEAVATTPGAPNSVTGDGNVSTAPAALTVARNGAPPAAIKTAAPAADKTTRATVELVDACQRYERGSASFNAIYANYVDEFVKDATKISGPGIDCEENIYYADPKQVFALLRSEA